MINDSANATLAVGASPIMATNPSDCKDLSPVIGSLLVNFGYVPDITPPQINGIRTDNVERSQIKTECLLPVSCENPDQSGFKLKVA